MGGLDQTQGIKRFTFPQRQTGAVQTLLKKSEVKPGIVSDQSRIFGKLDKLPADAGKHRRIGNDLIGNMVNRHHAGGY